MPPSTAGETTAGTNGERMCLANMDCRRRKALFFDSGGTFSTFSHSRASGNPVRIGDGCATVTGYKLPAAESRQEPLVIGIGKAGVRF